MILNRLDIEEELRMSSIDFLPKARLSYAIRQKIYVPDFYRPNYEDNYFILHFFGNCPKISFKIIALPIQIT